MRHGDEIRLPPVGVKEQLHCFFFAGEEGGRRGGRGGEDGLGLLTVGARPEPGQSDDGNPKQRRNCEVAREQGASGSGVSH